MSEHERNDQAPVWPARAPRPIEKVMKVVLLVAAVALGIPLLYIAFYVTGVSMAD